jgi:hypothetical protein
MDVANRAPLNHEMSTQGRGRITEIGRGSLIGKRSELLSSMETRNSALEPDSFIEGVQGDVGVMDPGCLDY